MPSRSKDQEMNDLPYSKLASLEDGLALNLPETFRDRCALQLHAATLFVFIAILKNIEVAFICGHCREIPNFETELGSLLVTLDSQLLVISFNIKLKSVSH